LKKQLAFAARLMLLSSGWQR